MKNSLLKLNLIIGMFMMSSYLVSSQPIANFTINATNGVCPGTGISFTNTSTNATSYYWEFGDGSISSGTNPNYIYSYGGSYIITLTATNGTQSSVIKKAIYLRDKPYASFNLNIGLYKPGELIKPVNFSTSSISYKWDIGLGGIIYNQERIAYSYANPGTYDLKLTTYNGCGDSALYTQSISVIDTNTYKPVASGYVSPLIACPGSIIQLYNYTNLFTSIKWMMDDGNVINNNNNFQYTFAKKGIYIVKQVVYYKNQTDTAKYTVLITDTTMEKSGVSATISPSVYDYNTSSMRYITCAGSKFKFNGSYMSEIVKHTWKLPGGIVIDSKDTSYNFPTIGDYPLIYVYQNACGVKDSISYMLNVRDADSIKFDPPSIMINSGPGNKLCPGNKANFVAYTSGDVSIKWIFHDGTVISNSNSVWKQYQTAGTYTVKFVQTNSCGRSDTTFRSLEISATADSYSDFTITGIYSPGTPKCVSDSVFTKTDTISNPLYLSQTITQHIWDMGDGTKYYVPEARHKYPNPGWYSITHQTTNACGQTSFTVHTLWANSTSSPIANFYVQQSSVCVNDSVLIDQFSQNADSIVIKMGDGNQIIINKNNFFPHIFYAYHTPGNYTVKLIAYNKCGIDSGTDYVTVMPPPSANILMNDTTIKTGTTLAINANTTGAVARLWKFGNNSTDTSTALSLSRQFNTTGVYTIYLFTMNASGCSNVDSLKITVAINPSAHEYLSDKLNIILYPNPAINQLHLLVESTIDSELTADIMDVNGKLVSHWKDIILKKGPNNFIKDISSVPAGVYIINIHSNEVQKNFKIIKF